LNDAGERSQLPAEGFIRSAIRIVEEAQKEGIILRIMGAVGFRIHTPHLAELHKRLNRLNNSALEFTDLDLMTYGRFSQKLESFFTALGYPADQHAKYQIHVWAQRHFYHDSSGTFKIDVFFDRLEMSHTIDFKDRLEVDSPTIPLAELLLEKMQILQISEKDIKDAIILLLGHEMGEDDADHINAKQIGSVLANDWGLWYTATMNLEKVRLFSAKYGELSESEKDAIASKVDALRKYVEDYPKGTKWKIRAKMGTKRKWYRDVEERYGTQ